MLPGPLFSIELITSARRARYFLLRVLYVAVLFWVLVTVHHSGYERNTTNIATVASITAAFFGTFSVVQLVAVVLVGPAVVAGAVAVERERRTIEYLFTTTLSNMEIVVGKLAARLVHILYLLLAGMPVLSLAMLLGGIAPESLGVSLIITLSTMFTVAAMSISVSVWTARARDAVARSYLLLLLLLILPPLLFGSLQSTWIHAWIEPVNEQLLVANPFWAFAEIMTQSSPRGTVAPWTVLTALVRNQMIFSIVILAAATLAVRRVHLRKSGSVRRWSRWRWQLFRPKIGNQPMLWKELFADRSIRLGLVGYLVLGLAVLAVITISGFTLWETIHASHHAYGVFGREYLQYSVFMGTFICCGALLLMVSRAAGSVTSEKERECWDSLLSTPLEAREIVIAKILGSLWSIRGLLLLLAIIWGPGVVLAPSFFLAIPFTLGTLLAIAAFIAALGVLVSLRAKNSTRAIATTMLGCLFLGGGYLFCCTPMMIGSHGGGQEIMLTPCIPFLLAFPGMISFEGMPSHNADIMPAYILGVLFYLGGAAILYSIAVESFDSATDRTRVGDQPFVAGNYSSGNVIAAAAVDKALETIPPATAPTDEQHEAEQRDGA